MHLLKDIGVALISGLGGTILWIPGGLPAEFGVDLPTGPQGFSPRQ